MTEPTAPAEPTEPTEPAAPATYALPGSPPTGTRLKGRSGKIYHRVPPAAHWSNNPLPADAYGYWAEVNDDAETPTLYGWHWLLLEDGPLAGIPPTPEEIEEERLYGPVGARWGDPGTPCPFLGCALGVGHIGWHRRDDGSEFTFDPDPSLTPPSTKPHMDVLCTCGRPAMHEPGCPRRERMEGTGQ